MINKGRKIYIGSAWPYANGSLHLGHVSSLIGADILARYFRQSGADVLWTSGSDCHGTPIVVAAEEEGTTPEELALRYHNEFRKILIDGLGFSYNNYTTTLTDHHAKVVQEIFLKLYQQGDIYTKTEVLPYCPKCDRFLPDRYIEGRCPKCNYKSARGDQCDECASLLDAKDLIDPKCKTCDTSPVFKESEHFFLALSKYQEKIEKFLDESKNWRTNAKGFTRKFLNEGLKDRAITRDTKWGIPIPIEGYESKRIYVWFEAVCGYFSSSIEYAHTLGKADLWREFWENDKAYHYYVHGKDNIPFHSIIWPIILMARGGLNLPDSILSSEYLTLDKKQFSKSRHWAVLLPDFLKDFDSDLLRYYLIANGCETSDADFTWEDFAQRINKELIGNFANFIYRTLQLIENNFDGKLSPNGNLTPEQLELEERTIKTFEVSGELIETGKFRDALKNILLLAEDGNRFLAKTEPWKKIKVDRDEAETDLFVCAQIIYSLATLINPFMPKTAEKINKLLKKSNDSWTFERTTKVEFSNSSPLFKKVEKEDIEAQVAKLG